MTQRELTNRLNVASIKYYRGETTEYTDTQFDLALKELQKMEKESGYVFPDSPTLRVGSDLQSGFGKVQHKTPMLTIENTYTEEELSEWGTKMNKEYGVKGYRAEIKYDGVSLELLYRGGHFVNASTRGDKNVGDDVTLNAYGIHDIPFELIGFEDDEEFRVRGEVLMPKSVLAKLNEERIANGEQPFANTRNACAGSLKQLDPKVTASRGLIFRPWDCLDGSFKFTNMGAKHSLLEELGFKYEFMPEYVGVEYLSEKIELLKKKIDEMNLDYDYDGLVIKVDNINIQNEIGTKDTRAIEWGIARKWNEQYEVWTELQGVDWQVGRTGVLTPVGRLEPVECNGVVISNVTLHNIDFIESINLHIGNDLKLTRSGGVIPYVLECKHDLLMEMNGAYPKVRQPIFCPVCGHLLEREGALLKCVNEKCPAIIKGKILQFCSKDGMDIRTIGEKVVDDLVDKGVVTSVDNLYAIANARSANFAADLAELLGEGYGEHKCQKMLDSIKESVNKPFDVVLASLSIPSVGKSTARLLAKKFKNCETLKNATIDDLISVDGIGEVMAYDISMWFKDKENLSVLSALQFFGVKMAIEEEAKTETATTLAGLSVVFSGKSSRFNGDEVEEFLEKNGAKCGHSVSKKTNYLITGDKAGASKVQKAKELGVEIIPESDFYTKFNL